MGNGYIYEKILTVVSFAVMLVINILANSIPMNGMTTGEISDNYPNLLTPAGYAFSIWALIYLFLLIFIIYQLDVFPIRLLRIKPEVLNQVRILFVISSFLNAAWIMAWHYDFIAFSLMLIAAILICLMYINRIINLQKLSKREEIIIRLPFSIYFGWITVATVNNMTVLLVSIRWRGFGLHETIWTIIVLIIVLIITTYSTQHNKDMVYGFAVIWGYIGILIKHISKLNLSGKYPDVITTIIVCIIVLAVGEVYLYLSKKNIVSRDRHFHA